MFQRTPARPKVPGVLILGALTAAALGIATVESVPTANATCASFFGLGSGGQCTSTITSIAIAIGENAEAHADGLLGAALTLGNNSNAVTFAGSLFNLAATLGDSNGSFAGGIGSLALAASGINQTVLAGESPTSGDFGNIAASFGAPEGGDTIAKGVGNISVNLFGSGDVDTNGVGLSTFNVVGLSNSLTNRGVLNNVTNLSGDNNTITNDVGDGGIGNLAFNAIGSANTIRSSGTLAVAGAIGSTGQTVSQAGFGINVAVGRSAAQAAATKSAAAGLAATSASANTPKKSTPTRNRGKRSGR